MGGTGGANAIRAAAALACLALGAAWADDRLATDPDAEARLRDYASQLNDPRLEVREGAGQKLSADVLITGQAIEAFVKQRWEELAPETTERFMLAARSRYVACPGAIGIEFETETPVIRSVRQEAPAARVLQRGDRFLMLNGVTLTQDRMEQPKELRRIMFPLQPGDVVKARIRRQAVEREVELNVEFPLADPTQLREFEGYITEMKRDMLDMWNARRREQFPPRPKMAIDLRRSDRSALESSAESTGALAQRQAITEELRGRISEVSEQIARLAERTAGSEDPARRAELEREYLRLRDDLFGLNARLRLVDIVAPGRPRR